MNGINKALTIKLAVVSTVVTASSLVPAQPASAQLLEMASGAALSILKSITGQSKPQPAPPVVIPQQPIPPQTPKFDVGTGNFNGNTLNLCISGCLPSGSQAMYPRPNTMNTLPPGTIAQPVTPVPPQPAPNQPVLTIPPISLPMNF